MEDHALVSLFFGPPTHYCSTFTLAL